MRSIRALRGRDNRATRPVDSDPRAYRLPKVVCSSRGTLEGCVRPQNPELVWKGLVKISQKNFDAPGSRLKTDNPCGYIPIPSSELKPNPLIRFPPPRLYSLPGADALRTPDHFRLCLLGADPFQQSSISPMISLSNPGHSFAGVMTEVWWSRTIFQKIGRLTIFKPVDLLKAATRRRAFSIVNRP